MAFLFGIASHMVADVSWHSLGIDQGFLKAMGEVSLYYFIIDITGFTEIDRLALESVGEGRKKLEPCFGKIFRKT